MRLHRFYIKENINLDKELVIQDKDLINQVRNVFRMKKNDRVIFFDGSGMDFVSEILVLEKNKMIVIPKEEKEAVILKKNITLFQVLVKKDNFEFIAEKCTGVGVSSIVPVISERSEKKSVNIERIEKILKEASEQSGRAIIPKISSVIKFIDLPFEEVTIFAADLGGEDVKEINFPDGCGILIGPEGGFSEEERMFLKEKGVKSFSLGETVLRAETAAIVASAFSIK